MCDIPNIILISPFLRETPSIEGSVSDPVRFLTVFDILARCYLSRVKCHFYWCNKTQIHMDKGSWIDQPPQFITEHGPSDLVPSARPYHLRASITSRWSIQTLIHRWIIMVMRREPSWSNHPRSPLHQAINTHPCGQLWSKPHAGTFVKTEGKQREDVTERDWKDAAWSVWCGPML